MNYGTFQRGEANKVYVPVSSASAFNEGDAIATDGSGNGYRASSQTWDTDLATTRAAFVAKFTGISAQAKDANKPILGNGTARGYDLGVYGGGVVTLAVKAGTYTNGLLLGPAKQSGNLLEDQLYEIVGSEAQATHRVQGRFGTNPGVVEATILSKTNPVARQS